MPLVDRKLRKVLYTAAYNTALLWAFGDRVEPLESHWDELGGSLSVAKVIKQLSDLGGRQYLIYPDLELQASSLAIAAKHLVGALIKEDYSEARDTPRSLRSLDSWEAITTALHDALIVVWKCHHEAGTSTQKQEALFTYLGQIVSTRLSAVHILRQSGLAGMERLPRFSWHPDLKNVLEPEEVARPRITEINREFMAHLAKHPEYLHQVSPRGFEKIVAELLHDMGCEVELTQQTKDGGRDVLAAFQTPFGRMLGIVECKRSKPSARLGVDLVRSFLWVLEREDRANFGLIVTTAMFSRDVWKLQAREQRRLKLKEFQHLKEWLSRYGQWTESNTSGLWLPKTSPTKGE